MEIKILKKKACQKVSTVNPATILEQIRTSTALITKRKSPSVKIVTGKVSNTKIGFTIAFKTAKTNATIIEVPKLVT